MVNFNELDISKDMLDEMSEIDVNGTSVSVRQYLPAEEKLQLIQRVLNNTVDDTGYYNILSLDINFYFEVVKAYSNIVFTDEEVENYIDTFDLLEANNVISLIISEIPSKEINYLRNACLGMTNAIVTYRNSAKGILEAIGSDYSATKIDLEEIKNNITDPNQLEFVKRLLDKIK